MTISTTTSRASYNGNGVTTVFSVPFRFFASSDLVVELVTVSTGASTTLALTTHYTVTGADDESGGSLTMLTAPAVGERLVIRRVITATQEVDYVSGDPFPAETHERALDRLTMLSQQGEEVTARALVFPSGDTASGEIPAVVTRANKLLGFNSSGELEVTAPASGSAAELALDLASTASGKGAELVGFLPAGTGAVATDVQTKLREVVSVKDFGAVGDGVTDDTPAVLAGVAHLKAIGGGTLFFPQGTYRVTSEILIDSPSIRFVGTGRRKVYPGVFSHTTDIVSTIMPVHSNTAAVRFFNATVNTASSFSAEGINFATLETGSMPTCCFGFDGSGNFHRDFTFERVGIHGFTSAFDTYNTGGDTAFGLLKVINCTINRNGYIARNLTGQWNGFVFEKNEAGQNTSGGVDIKAQAASIRQNSMEGQPNPVKIQGIYRGIEIAGNYFELNSGSYVVHLQETLNAVVSANFWLNNTATEQLKLTNDVGTTVIDRVIPSCYGSFDLRTYENAIDPVPLGSASSAMFLDESFVCNIQAASEIGGLSVGAPAGPHYALQDSAGDIYTSSGTGLTTITKSGLSVASGNYIGVALVISYQNDSALPPRLVLRVNSTITDGYLETVYYNFERSTQKLQGKTVLYYGVVKATAAVSSMQMYLYPFGLNPSAGLVAYVSACAIYDLGATLPSVSNVGSFAKAMIPETHVKRVTAAPLAGTWPAGYRLLARSPAAAGFEGWICTTAGTPGTWKTYGAISA